MESVVMHAKTIAAAVDQMQATNIAETNIVAAM
jgi:hypothetical protein